jgi:hypothetical protein
MGYFAQDPAESLEFSERPDTLASDERGGHHEGFCTCHRKEGFNFHRNLRGNYQIPATQAFDRNGRMKDHLILSGMRGMNRRFQPEDLKAWATRYSL